MPSLDDIEDDASGSDEPSQGGSAGDSATSNRPMARSLPDIQAQYDFQGTFVRTILRDKEPWFVVADVCSVLEIANPRNVYARLDDDERGVAIMDTPSGQQQMNIINESGLYALILTSRKPQAKAFRRWVTGEVLPSIRRTGRYSVNAGPEADPPGQAAPASSSQSSLCVTLGSMPIGDVCMSLAEYFLMHGYSAHNEDDIVVHAPAHEPELRRWIFKAGRGGEAATHPTTGRWVYRRGALDAWWQASGKWGVPASRIPL